MRKYNDLLIPLFCLIFLLVVAAVFSLGVTAAETKLGTIKFPDSKSKNIPKNLERLFEFPERKIVSYVGRDKKPGKFREADFEYALRLKLTWLQIVSFDLNKHSFAQPTDRDFEQASKRWIDDNLLRLAKVTKRVDDVAKQTVIRAKTFPTRKALKSIHRKIVEFRTDAELVIQARLELNKRRAEDCNSRSEIASCLVGDEASVRNISMQSQMIAIFQKRYFEIEVDEAPAKITIKFVSLIDDQYEELTELPFDEDIFVQIELPDLSYEWVRMVEIEILGSTVEVTTVKIEDKLFRSAIPIVLVRDTDVLVQP